MVYLAPEYLLVFHVRCRKQSTKLSSMDLTSTASYQAFIGQVANLLPNMSSLFDWEGDSWTLLLSKMGSRTPTVLWWLHWHHRCVFQIGTIWCYSSSL